MASTTATDHSQPQQQSDDPSLKMNDIETVGHEVLRVFTRRFLEEDSDLTVKNKFLILKALLDNEVKDYKDTKQREQVAAKDAVKMLKKTKVKKDPNRVKKPLSVYICFSNDVRQDVVKKNPDIDQKLVLKKIGEMWAKIKDDPKKNKRYVKMAQDDKVRYEREMKEHASSSSSDDA